MVGSFGDLARTNRRSNGDVLQRSCDLSDDISPIEGFCRVCVYIIAPQSAAFKRPDK
jgi:hypothetical protein